MIHDQFQFFYEKKGSLASQKEQSVKIVFTPQKYRFFETEIRLIIKDKILRVPITAYPVLNLKRKSIFPKFIDFKIREVDQVYLITHNIYCDIPLNFQFEFKYLKKHPWMKIYPLKGVLPGNSFITITIEFAPRKAQTVFMETEVV